MEADLKQRRRLQIVTLLTFIRFPLVLLFFAGAILNTSPAWRHEWLFNIVYASMVLAAATDMFDGYYARKWRVTTQFGAHADPLMDKFFYLAALPLLVFVICRNGEIGHATFMLVLTLLFLARDQWVTFLRSIGAMYQADGKANWSGKLRTAINFPMVCVVYYYVEAPVSMQFIPAWFVYTFEGVAFGITIMTLFIYTRNYWPYLKLAARVHPCDP